MDSAQASEHDGVRRMQVPTGQAGRRIDNFLLAHCRGVPRSRIYQMLRRGEVRVNGSRVQASHRIQAGDWLRLPPMRTRPTVTAPGGERLLARSLYEDEAVLVLDKPAGLAVHSGSGCPHGLIERLHGLASGSELHLVHRLDRWTSGCLLLARDLGSLRALHAEWRSERVQKYYQALLCGRINARSWHVDAPLQRGQLRGGQRVTGVDRQAGRAAWSDFRATRRFAEATLVSVRLRTGRTHQIRVHARHMGHPVAGDPKYAGRGDNRRFRSLGLRRPFLHACSLRFTSPDSRRPVHVEAPLPEELLAVLDRLRPSRQRVSE